ncbi:putative MFS-type transporter [Cyphellophora attinorum]|uniref:Putative MFS-type transporter n=1 Tax=Cyphellophora attinorum TaxID=1664694 RepID=A0A0N0NQJ4_9EURO|nr:putative MFS-type transporter [Phialophora attinorum]KPI43978.1 putative MFS-type transporter [Phialophora attinorum]
MATRFDSPALLLLYYMLHWRVGPIVSSMAIAFITEWGINFTDVTLLTGYLLCATGATGVVIASCSRKYGKRPTLLWSISFAFGGSVWASFSQSYGSLVGARVLQGFGIAMFESVTYTVISDLYHVHQRGTRITYYILAQSGLATFPVTIAGKITMDLGWRWVFYLLSLFMGLAWVLCILFGWETMYGRTAVCNLDTSSQDQIDKVLEQQSTSVHELETTTDLTNAPTPANDAENTRETFLQRLKPFHGTFSDQNLWTQTLRPFLVLLNPLVIWYILIISFTTVWVIVISFCTAQAFYRPPYSLSIAQQGYMSAGPIVGGLLGCIACGLICDPLARSFARRNSGIYEPEFRGDSCGSICMFGLVYVSVQFAAVSAGAYVVDAFRDISVDIFIIAMTIKNFLFFGFTYFLNDWYARWGPARMFNTIGGIQLALSLTTIPVYIYGKRLRHWWHNLELSKRIQRGSQAI